MAETITIEKLRDVVHSMDALSQEGLTEIKAIARLAMYAFLTPEGQSDVDAMTWAMRAVWSRAEQSGDVINATADEVGCQYTDADVARRFHARQEADAISVRGEESLQ